MIEISYKKPNILCVKNADKKEITFDTELRTVMMDDFNVTYQGEYENIEAKLVIPYGEGKDVFLNTVGQHSEPVKSHKVWTDLDWDRTEFVNLEG